MMKNTPENLLKEYVKGQKFTSTTQVMDAMKDMFKGVLEQVMECELEQNLGFEKSRRMANCDDSCTSKNYRNGYSKKTVKTQLGELEVNIPRDRDGNYTPQMISEVNKWQARPLEEDVVFGGNDDCQKMDGEMSKLGCSAQSAQYPICG